MNKSPRIAFVSPHCILDFTNGAATATRDGLSVNYTGTATISQFTLLESTGSKFYDAMGNTLSEVDGLQNVSTAAVNELLGERKVTAT
jgi:hypothetical protein